MTEKTQAAVVHYALEAGAVEVREVPVPEIGPDDVLLKVAAVSVCGSDIHQAHNTHSWPVNIPVVLGHEFSGSIAAVGKNVANFREGDRVVSETAAKICGNCVLCRSGRYNLCSKRLGFGYGVNGAMTSYVKTPARCLHHIPKDLPFFYACLTEPCCVAYHALCVNAEIKPGDSVLVIGPGPIGLLCARMAALSGAHPLIVAGRAVDKERLQIAKALGASHTVNVDDKDLLEFCNNLEPSGLDLICEASGATRPLDRAIKLAKPDGQVVKVGWSPDDAQLI